MQLYSTRLKNVWSSVRLLYFWAYLAQGCKYYHLHGSVAISGSKLRVDIGLYLGNRLWVLIGSMSFGLIRNIDQS